LDYNGFGNKLCIDVTVTSTLKYHDENPGIYLFYLKNIQK
jgi:hypothetical protein